MITPAAKKILIGSLLLWLAGCSTTTVRTTEYIPAIQEPQNFSEDQLLDVGIGIFNPGVDDLSKEEEGVYPQVRRAEARYMPFQLMDTLQKTGNWGVVRVIPDRESEMDVWVDAEILKSDGESLELMVKVRDTSGNVWFTKKYSETASKYSYDNDTGIPREPFQGLYNHIANDMLLYRRQVKPDEARRLRTITELKFAREFAPDVYSEHLETDGKGNYTIKRLPAESDPVLQRVRKIRERDYMFVDTLQEYYGTFVDQMRDPYMSWRKESYFETMALRELKQKSNARLLGGALAVLAGIAGVASNNPYAQAAGTVGIGAGAYVFKSGLDKREEAKMHIEALEELGKSLDAEVKPHTITLEDRTVTLKGTVKEQYAQWRKILRDIYLTETGQAVPVGH